MNQHYPKNVPITGRVRICLEMLTAQTFKNKKVVDVGSSFGWLEKEVQSLGAKELIGIEPDAVAVAFAKKNVKQAKFMVGDALNVPLPKTYADIVALYDVVEHVPKGTELMVLKEMNRVLKTGGVLLLSTPFDSFVSKVLDLAWYFGHRHYSLKKIKEMLKKAGFKVVEMRVRGSFFSSFYLFWFYISKKLLGTSQPRSSFLERLDDSGYDSGHLTDIFLIAKKVKG